MTILYLLSEFLPEIYCKAVDEGVLIYVAILIFCYKIAWWSVTNITTNPMYAMGIGGVGYKNLLHLQQQNQINIIRIKSP